MDGFGLQHANPYNAITLAHTPNLDRIYAEYPTVTLKTSGLFVGLPRGLMGNSEVGHLNLGAGRVVYQDVTRIDRSIDTGEFYHSPILYSLISDLKLRKRNLHLLGLVSRGGVHASMKHLEAILKLCKRQNFSDVFLHAFTDGRDSAPRSGLGFIRQTENWMKELGVGRIASVSGRYYAMDRDKRWDRTEKAYRAICLCEGNRAASAQEAVQSSYDQDVTDEFIIPTVIGNPDSAVKLEPEDGAFFFNFRSDRARQMTLALTDPEFSDFPATVKITQFVSMVLYREDFRNPVVFPPVRLEKLLGEVISEAGFKQLRISETEKYPHVTFFFNGGTDQPFPGEDRILIPSPKVATYDLQPEMSEPELTKKLCEAIVSEKYDFIVANYPNCDMVGHSGIVPATVKAVEAVDHGVGEMWAAAKYHGYAVLLTADHGNAEQMWDERTRGPHTAHTTNLVPLTLLYDPPPCNLLNGGKLGDIAPTVLDLMEIEQPDEMTGESLLDR